jgi:hypothetical protein
MSVRQGHGLHVTGGIAVEGADGGRNSRMRGRGQRNCNEGGGMSDRCQSGGEGVVGGGGGRTSTDMAGCIWSGAVKAGRERWRRGQISREPWRSGREVTAGVGRQ